MAILLAPGDDALRGLCFSDPVFRQRYDGWSVLGRGSFGTVVKVHSRDVARDLALKIFVNLDPESIERVRREVHASQRLATPYMVQTYSLFDRGAITWFEMEFVDGSNLQLQLDRLAAEGRRLAPLRAYDIALAVVRCLRHAHQREVYHRDVKPANILLPALGRPAAKLGDFGIARLADAARATPPGTITGTPRFASPEALAGHPVGRAHDIYSLCATLYALFSGGRLPYEVGKQASIADLRRLQLEGSPRPLKAAAPELDAAVSVILMKGLARDPLQRPGLRKIVETLKAVRARTASAADRTAKEEKVSMSPWGLAAAAYRLGKRVAWAPTVLWRRNDAALLGSTSASLEQTGPIRTATRGRQRHSPEGPQRHPATLAARPRSKAESPPRRSRGKVVLRGVPAESGTKQRLTAVSNTSRRFSSRITFR